MAEKEDLTCIVCAEVGTRDIPSDATLHQCDFCGCWVWITPTAQHILDKIPQGIQKCCETCFRKKLDEADDDEPVKVEKITDGQVDDILAGLMKEKKQ